MLEEKFDFVIIVNGLSTNFKDGRQNELIELNWCTYDLKKKSVNSELGAFIHPNSMKEIDQSYLNECNVTYQQLENADDLLEVLKKFNLFIFESFISKNFSFAFLTKDDSLLGRNGNGQLITEALSKNIKLGFHFSKYFNLIREFKGFYKIDKLGSSETPNLSDILQFYSLKKTEMERPILQELNTMVRIVNRMVKEGYEFISKRLISGESVKVKENTSVSSDERINLGELDKEMKDYSNDNANVNSNIMIKEENINVSKEKIPGKNISPTPTPTTKKNEKSISQSKSKTLPLPQLDYSAAMTKPQTFFLRIKNLPYFVDKKDIKDLLYLYNVTEDDIVISFDIFGRKTGEVCLKVCNQANYSQIISSFNFRLVHDKVVEVIPSNESDFTSCSKSSLNTQNTQSNNKRKIFLKMKNIPYTCKEDSLRTFLKHYSPAENGIKLFKNKKGSFLGESVIAFNYEEDAAKALKDKNGESLMNQIVSLEYSNLEEFELYSSTNAFYYTIKNLCDFVTPDIVTKSLFISGLPLDITKEEFVKQMEMFNINESNLIIDEKSLASYGCLILTLPSEEDAQFVKSYLGKSFLKHRNREVKILADNLLLLVNKGNES